MGFRRAWRFWREHWDEHSDEANFNFAASVRRKEFTRELRMNKASKSLLIKGGHLIDPAAKINAPMDLLLRDGRVAEVAAPNKIRGTAEEKFNARGLIVAPGFIDLHVHLREPGQSYKETFASGTSAAAAGGFTSVCTMPNTVPVVDTADLVSWQRSPERGAAVNVFPIAAATQASQGQTLTDFGGLQRAGAVAVTDDGKPILHDEIMRAALQLGAELNLPVVQHAEDTRLTENCSMHFGPSSFRLGLRGMSASAEAAIVDRDVTLAQQIRDARLHVAHLSTAEALKAVRRGKRAKTKVTCEVTPHHFSLIDENIGEYDTHFKMNPPLRSAADREAILVALADGTVDAIATDHAPHAAHEKEVEFERAAFGITGLETALGLAISLLHREHKTPLARIIELFSSGPARVFDLRNRGSLASGSFADVTIFDPKKRWTFDASRSHSLSRNTPFDGWQFTGKVIATIVGGKIVYLAD
jgi:dihydroorotase